MPRHYQCPTCTGGFPADVMDDGACPWCGQRLGDLDAEDFPRTVTAVTETENNDEQGAGWLFK